MRILTGYILRSHLGPFLFALAALTFIMLLDQLGKRFGMLVGKGLHWTVIVEVFVLSLPFIVAVTLPMAVLVAVLYTFNRMASDNEIAAIKASGVPLTRLVWPVAGAATLLGLGLVWFNSAVLPDSNHRLQLLLRSIGQKQPTFALEEQTINEVRDQELFIRVARIDHSTNDLAEVVIYDQRDHTRSRTIYADRGRMAYSTDQTDLYLTLFDGVTQEEKSDEPDAFQRMHFQEMVMRIPDVSNELERRESGYRGDREMPVSQLRAEVERARANSFRVREESRGYSVALTARLLGGLAPEEPMPEEIEAPEELMAPDELDPPEELERLEEAEEAPGARAGDAPLDGDAAAAADGDAAAAADGDAAAAADEEDRAERARTEVEDSRQRGADNVERLRSVRSAASQFGTYDTRLTAADRRANRYAVEIHKKYSIPAACVIFVLIGGPLAIRFRQGGVGLVVGASLVIFCAYYVALVGGEELANNLILSPFWAMWAPNVVFGAVGGVAMWKSVRGYE